jgi:hypothetical protein
MLADTSPLPLVSYMCYLRPADVEKGASNWIDKTDMRALMRKNVRKTVTLPCSHQAAGEILSNIGKFFVFGFGLFFNTGWTAWLRQYERRYPDTVVRFEKNTRGEYFQVSVAAPKVRQHLFVASFICFIHLF